MIRKLKPLGLALAAICVVSALVGPAASAEELTSDGPVKLTGGGAGEKATFTGFGLSATCQGEYTVGLENQTPHTYFDPTILFVAIFTVAPHYTNCDATLGESKSSGTVTMNGCDYLVHVANGAENWEVVCPPGQQIEMHSYASPSHSSTICTIKIPAQSGITGGNIENVKEGGVEKLTIKESLSGIHASKTGLLCGGSAEISNGVMDLHAVISGVNTKGEATGISITP